MYELCWVLRHLYFDDDFKIFHTIDFVWTCLRWLRQWYRSWATKFTFAWDSIRTHMLQRDHISKSYFKFAGGESKSQWEIFIPRSFKYFTSPTHFSCSIHFISFVLWQWQDDPMMSPRLFECVNHTKLHLE
jgi:hypothetical protein